MKLLLLISLLGLTSCASLTSGGKRVQIIKVSTNKLEIQKEKKKLIGNKCEELGNIEAPIATGSTPIPERLAIGLRNKTAEVGGNVVLSITAT